MTNINNNRDQFWVGVEAKADNRWQKKTSHVNIRSPASSSNFDEKKLEEAEFALSWRCNINKSHGFMLFIIHKSRSRPYCAGLLTRFHCSAMMQWRWSSLWDEFETFYSLLFRTGVVLDLPPVLFLICSKCHKSCGDHIRNFSILCVHRKYFTFCSSADLRNFWH